MVAVVPPASTFKLRAGEARLFAPGGEEPSHEGQGLIARQWRTVK